MKKKLAVALAATMLVVGMLAAHLWQVLRAEREGLAGLQAQVSNLQSAPQATAHAAVANIVAPAVAASGHGQQPVSPTPASTAAQRVASFFAIAKAGAGTLEGQRLQLAQRYPDLARDLGLSPADAEKFLDMIARQAVDALGLTSSKSREGKTQEEVRRMVYEGRLAEEREQTAMLGSKYQQWPVYQGTEIARDQISELQTVLGASNSTLTEAQRIPLEAAMGAEIARFTKEMQDSAMSAPLAAQSGIQTIFQYEAEKNRRTISAATSYLTPSQLDDFKRMLAKQEEATRAADARMKRVDEIRKRIEAGQ